MRDKKEIKAIAEDVAIRAARYLLTIAGISPSESNARRLCAGLTVDQVLRSAILRGYNPSK